MAEALRGRYDAVTLAAMRVGVAGGILNTAKISDESRDDTELLNADPRLVQLLRQIAEATTPKE